MAQKLLYWKTFLLIPYKREWDYDGHEKPRQETLSNGKSIIRIPGYTEGAKPGAKGDYPGAYVDSPTKEQTLRVEAWCRCPDKSDRLLTQRDINYKHHEDF